MTLFQTLRAFERAWLRPLVRAARRPKAQDDPGAANRREARLAWARQEVSKGNDAHGLRIAMLSPLPPSSTGIAFCSSSYFQSQSWRMDLYGMESIQDLERVRDGWREGQARALPLDALGQVVPVTDYDALILQMGNSDHHAATLRAWREAASAFRGPRAVFLHEAQLIRLWSRWCEEHPLRLHRLYRDHYPDRAFRLADLFTAQDPGSKVPRGIRILLDLAQPDRILVNSAFCASLVRTDLDGWTGQVPPIHEVFLPIPDIEVPVAAPRGTGLRIGHFGNMSSGKGVNLLVDAVKRMRAQSPVVLVLAGFGAGRFARRHGLHRISWIEVHDSPPDAGLMGLMASVDVAVQLRYASQGESSGVISQLLGLEKPVVVTGLGSFAELGEAVIPVPPEADALRIVAAVEEALSQPRGMALRALKQRYGLGAFQRTILDILQGGRASGGAPKITL